MTSAIIMRWTLVALVPGCLALVWQFGWGIAVNLVAASAFAALCEAAMLLLRKESLTQLRDCSALLTGALLGLALPPLLPLWMLLVGVFLAIAFGKHVYGGLGRNIFNPAMVGYAALIVAFPLAMSQWPEPRALASQPVASNSAINNSAINNSAINASAMQLLSAKFTLTSGRVAPAGIDTGISDGISDGISSATTLDAFKFRQDETVQAFFDKEEAIGNAYAWAQINLAFLVGGLLLLGLRIIPWQLPVGFLATLAALSLVFNDGGSAASLGSPLMHLFSGGTMLAAFFIITDPVTSPSLPLGLLIFAAGAAMLTFLIRTTGAYPDGVAFAVLLMNGAAPLIDHLLLRRRGGAR